MKTFIAGVLIVAAAGCVEHRDGVTATQSLKVDLIAPTDVGAPDRRLDTTNRSVTVVVTALGPDKAVDTTFNYEVGVRTQFLGAVTPPIIDQNIPQIMLTNGVSAPTNLTLPDEVFGPTVVWVEDEGGAAGTCGDGEVGRGERCDDGNVTAGDGCGATCQVENGKTCTGEPSVCRPTTADDSCGDGAISSTEECDDTHLEDGDGCSSACKVEPGFECTLWPSECHPVTYATGTSPTIWYRDPFIHDIQQADETAINPLLTSPLEDRQVSVTGSKYNLPSTCPTMDCGKLIVTSTYAQGYTVSDVDCGPGGTPPCTTGDYDSVLVFSFQRPRDENGCDLAVGELIDGFAGAVQEFTGQTEIGFPQTFVAATDQGCGNRVVDTAALPEPFHIDPTWFDNGGLQFERAEGALVSVDAATLAAGFPVACPLDMEYTTYKQWELDIGSGCTKPISAITSGTVATWVPEDHVGQTLTRVVGAFRPVNFTTGGGVWIVYPRSESDLVP